MSFFCSLLQSPYIVVNLAFPRKSWPLEESALPRIQPFGLLRKAQPRRSMKSFEERLKSFHGFWLELREQRLRTGCAFRQQISCKVYDVTSSKDFVLD